MHAPLHQGHQNPGHLQHSPNANAWTNCRHLVIRQNAFAIFQPYRPFQAEPEFLIPASIRSPSGESCNQVLYLQRVCSQLGSFWLINAIFLHASETKGY